MFRWIFGITAVQTSSVLLLLLDLFYLKNCLFSPNARFWNSQFRDLLEPRVYSCSVILAHFLSLRGHRFEVGLCLYIDWLYNLVSQNFKFSCHLDLGFDFPHAFLKRCLQYHLWNCINEPMSRTLASRSFARCLNFTINVLFSDWPARCARNDSERSAWHYFKFCL